MLPLCEAKMLHLYDTRWATYEPEGSTRPMTEDEKAERLTPMPRYWVAEAEIDRKLGGAAAGALIGWRRICRATDARTLILTSVPRLGFGDSWFLALPGRDASHLQAFWSSYALDYVARQKLGGTNMNFYTFMQLPMSAESHLDTFAGHLDRSVRSWIGLRIDRLNAWIADADDRVQTRAELDALVFHVFGLARSEVSYILDTFPIVKRKDEASFGSYRTKDLIQAAYDALAEAKESGQTYRSPWGVTA